MVRTRGCQKCRAYKTTVELMEPGSESRPLLKWQMIEIRKYIKRIQIHQYPRKRINILIFRDADLNLAYIWAKFSVQTHEDLRWSQNSEVQT